MKKSTKNLVSQKMKHALLAYRQSAESLESIRARRVSEIQFMSDSTFIPILAKKLPQGYSFNSPDTEVVGIDNNRNAEAGRVPIAFEVRLRLQYEGEPIYPSASHDRLLDVAKVQHSLTRPCQKLAIEYGLARVVAMTEPVIMD